MNDRKPRWVYRFDNFSHALVLLREIDAERAERALRPIEREGMIQRFEYTWELAWKVMKDFLEEIGHSFDMIGPKYVLREALQAGLIRDREDWLDALETRNLMSHTYDQAAFEAAIVKISGRYLPLFEALHEKLLEARLKGDWL